MTKANLVPILAASSSGNLPIVPTVAPTPIHAAETGLSQEAKAGIIAGTTAAIALSFFVLAIFFLRWRSRSRKNIEPVEISQTQHAFQKQELDGTAFVLPSIHLMEKELDGNAFVQPRIYSMDKKAELTTYEVVELPDDPISPEIMSRPKKSWTPKTRRAGNKTTYAAYINVKKAKEKRMSSGKISPPISKFCSISCAPIREKFINLNRTLPPTPVWLSPRASRLSSPLPNTRRVRRNPVENFPNK